MVVGGIPVDAPTIETGSYVGTGSRGDSTNPISLTFKKNPKLVFISGGGITGIANLSGCGSSYTSGYEFIVFTDVSRLNIPNVKLVGNTMSWWSHYDAPGTLNASGTTYHYIALTI